MELYILDADYQQIGMIDEAESILWNKKYYDVGYCEIYTPYSGVIHDLLRRGNYVYRYNDDMFCKIETFELKTNAENGDYIIVTANDMASILEDRIVRWNTVFSGTVAEFIKRVLTDNVSNPAEAWRRIGNFVVDDSNFSSLTVRTRAKAHTEDLLTLIKTACKSAGYGFRLSFDIETRRLVFRLYSGKDKASAQAEEYIEFSPAYGNILSSSYKEDESNYKNVVYIGYKELDETQSLISMYKGEEDGEPEPTGEDRREIYLESAVSREIEKADMLNLYPDATKTDGVYYADVDGVQTAIAIADGEGEDEKLTATNIIYLNMVRSVGWGAMSGYAKTQEFMGDVDTTDTYLYKTDYDLGDIVKVKNDYGIEAEARITEIMESEDSDNGYVVEPTFEYLN